MVPEGGVEAYGGTAGYSELSPLSPLSGGRKRGKRNSKKRSKKTSKKYMKKMYRGGNDVEAMGSDDIVDTPATGGRRRNRNKNKKTRKGKVSKWIIHVKNFSKANKMDFRDALKDPKCKSSYHKMK